MSFLQESGVGRIMDDYQTLVRSNTMQKWEKFGFLDGLNESLKENMATLYENQAKYILEECCDLNSSKSGAFETIAFPMVRRVFSRLLANELVSVQAMNLPAGMIFFFKPTISERGVSGEGCGDLRESFENPIVKKLPPCVLSGTNCSHETFENCKSLYDRFYNNEMWDYSKGNFTVMCATGQTVCRDNKGFWNPVDATDNCATCEMQLAQDGSIREVVLEVKGFDSSLGTHGRIGQKGLIHDTDEFLSSLRVTNVGDDIVDPDGNVIVAKGCDIDYNFANQKYGQQLFHYDDVCDPNGAIHIKLNLCHPVCEATCTTIDGFVGASSATTFNPEDIAITYRQYDDMECATELANVSFDIERMPISVTTRKMSACWTPEAATDLKAYHNIDAEAEVTALLSEVIAQEIDREILRDLINGAAFTDKWHYHGWQNQKVQSSNYTQSSWIQTLVHKINLVNSAIQTSTLKGGATWIVTSPAVASLFDSMNEFHVDTNGLDQTFNIGVKRTGALSGRYKVYVDPYFPQNILLMGRKGQSILDTGYIYAPYVPVMLTPVLIDTDNYSMKRGIMTRYAKKMVNNKYYGKIIVHALPTLVNSSTFV